MRYRLAALVAVVALLAACAGSDRGSAANSSTDRGSRIYLLGQGWHAGLIIEPGADDDRMWPERADFPKARFIEVGWGDREFYPAEEPSTSMALSAALWPSPGAVFMSGLRSPPEVVFACSDLIELALSPPQRAGLLRYVHDSFDRPTGAGRVSPLAGVTGAAGRFYPARGRFHLFNTCNTWTAGALVAAGFAIGKPYPLTAGGLVERVRDRGRAVAPLPACFKSRLP